MSHANENSNFLYAETWLDGFKPDFCFHRVIESHSFKPWVYWNLLECQYWSKTDVFASVGGS